MQTKNIDFISIINELWESSPYSIVKEHVYGHRDDIARPLTPLEALNCWMDTLAKRIALHHINHHHHHPPYQPTSLGFGTIQINGTTVSSRVQQSLYYYILQDKLFQWICKNSSPVIQAPTTKNHTFSTKIFVTKWISKSLPTGSNLVKRKHRQFSNCPICNTYNEDLIHLVTCNHEPTSTLRLHLINDILKWMTSTKTHPNIISLYSIGLPSFFKDPNFIPQQQHPIFSDDQYVNSALSSQIHIGWMNSLSGFISEEIVTLQLHYKNISSRRSSSSWAKHLTLHLWQMLHKLWIHRNNILHQTQQFQVLSGLPILKTSMTREYNIGLSALPSLYSSYFHVPLSTILSRSPSHLIKWFLIIRSARESYQPVSYTHLTLPTSDLV